MLDPAVRDRTIAVIGVRSSAGAHHAGSDLAPKVLRERGLIARLQAAGLSVEDEGDIISEIFATDRSHPGARNLAAVVRVARTVADAVEESMVRGRLPLVLGGDCTITLGFVAGMKRVEAELGLAYFDGDADLTTPLTTKEGILDAMGVAHLLGIADTELARIGRGTLLRDDQIVLLGYDESISGSFDGEVLRSRPALEAFTKEEVIANPRAVAQSALARLRESSSGIAVHFDVDAVDGADLPLGNFPHYGSALTLDIAQTVLSTLLGAPELRGLVLTEVNPTHDPGGQHLDRYLEAIASALGGTVSASR